MLDSLMFFLEKIRSCKKQCTNKWWCIAWILTCPIQIVGWFFVQMGMGIKWCENKLELMMEQGQVEDKNGAYGFCPKCEVPVFIREKRPGGDDICANGHKYPSIETIPKKL